MSSHLTRDLLLRAPRLPLIEPDCGRVSQLLLADYCQGSVVRLRALLREFSASKLSLRMSRSAGTNGCRNRRYFHLIVTESTEAAISSGESRRRELRRRRLRGEEVNSAPQSGDAERRGPKILTYLGVYDPWPNAENQLVLGCDVEQLIKWLSCKIPVSNLAHDVLSIAGLMPPRPGFLLKVKRQQLKINPEMQI